MVIDTVKENLCVNKLIATKKEIIFVEGDMIVPDSKPDILSTICTSGIICMYKKEVLEGKVRIDGGVNVYIMYLSEDPQDKVRGLNTTLDFSENINIPNVQAEMECMVETKIKSIECKVINGRKIGIKATIEIELQIYSKEEIEIINDIQDAQGMQMLKEELKVNSLVGSGETKINAKDTIQIDNIDNLAEILKVKVCICDKDIKVSYNKILTKAEARIDIMYLTEDNRINSVTGRVPIVGFIDIPNVTEDNISDVSYEIRNIIIKPNQAEEHSIFIEMEVGVSCNVYEEKQINLIQDLYSPCENIECNRKNIVTMTDKKENKELKQIREKVTLEGLEGKNILDVDINTTINEEVELKEKIVDEPIDSYITSFRGKYIFKITDSTGVKTCYSYLPNNALIVLQEGAIKYKIPTLDSNGNYVLDRNDLSGVSNLSLYDEYNSCNNNNITAAKIISIASSVNS